MSYMGKVRPTIALLTDDIADDQVTSAKIADTTIVNADVNASAAIAQTKVALDITNSEVNASAAIAKTKLASLDVVNADVNASAGIVGSKLADNAITLAKMEDGTQGDVLYYGASGAPARLGFGTSGDFLKTQGTGANPVWASAGGDNTPSFYAYLSSGQEIANSTWEKIELDSEYWDTDSAFDSSTNYRFTVPSGEDGKYFFSYGSFVNNTGDGKRSEFQLYKNGAVLAVDAPGAVDTPGNSGSGGPKETGSVVLNLAADDYIELYVKHTRGSAEDASADITHMSGFKLLGV